MRIELNNPLPILCLNVLGLGFDLSMGITAEGKVLALGINFVFGTYSRAWELG